MAQLLALARAQQIDLREFRWRRCWSNSRRPTAAGRGTPLAHRGDWLVMAAWLLWLRSQLLLPAGSPAQHAASVEADRLRTRLGALRDAQALAGWLERRPQLGQEVFAGGSRSCSGRRSTPRIRSMSSNSSGQAWRCSTTIRPRTWRACIARCRPSCSTARRRRERILRLLAAAPNGAPLDRLLPEPPDTAETEARCALRQRSAWASTLAAGLELAKQGEVVMQQEEDFQTIQLSASGGQALSDAA